MPHVHSHILQDVVVSRLLPYWNRFPISNMQDLLHRVSVEAHCIGEQWVQLFYRSFGTALLLVL